MSFVLLPQQCGLGYYSYSEMVRQYGTHAAISTLLDVCEQIAWNSNDILIGIGDISIKGGGPLPPHHTHRQGTSIDIRPLRTDRKQSPVSIEDAEYDREATRLLVKTLLSHKNVRRILFNDSKIVGVHRCNGHDNHLHVDTKN